MNQQVLLDKIQTINSFLMLLVIILVSFLVGTLLSYAVAFPLCHFDSELVLRISEHPEYYPEYRTVVLLMQAITNGTIFIGSAWVAIMLGKKYQYYDNILRFDTQNLFYLTLFAFAILVTYMPFSAFLVEWNKSWNLPDAFKQFEVSAQATEERLAKITLFLINFQNTSEIIIGFLTIAVIPAIGEELLFRGVIQRLLEKIFGNIHLAIWISAFLFSALHLQFYGLLPRMFLGALFAYLYVFSGNFLLAIFAHFFNNAATLLALYLYHSGKTEINLQETAQSIPIHIGLLSLGLTIFLLYFYKRSNEQPNKK